MDVRLEFERSHRRWILIAFWVCCLLVLSSGCDEDAGTHDSGEETDPFDFWMNADAIDSESAPRFIAKLFEIRDALREHASGGSRYPTVSMPDYIQTDIADSYWDGLNNLDRIDVLRFDNALGFESVVYHFHPIIQRNRLVLYHQGHGGTFQLGLDTISGLLADGYSVMAFTMPLIGSHEPVNVLLPSGDEISVTRHADFEILEQAGMSVMDIFVEPLARALDYADEVAAYQSVDGVGLSGGGWTLVVYAATDPRLKRTYPVAASLPFHMRTDARDIGDFEQLRERPMFDIATYLEMYLLAALEPDRMQMQIFNTYDICCFASDGREEQFEQYAEQIKSLLSALGGGTFDVRFDDSHEGHIISAVALQWILDDLDRDRAD